MPLRLWGALAAIAAVLILLTASHRTAYQAGRQAERATILNRSVEVLRERSRTDDEIRAMDDAYLCRALGGVFTDGTCQ